MQYKQQNVTWYYAVKALSYLKGIDKCEIVECDVIVIILDVAKCLFVILHKGVDLTILPLKRRRKQ